MIKYTKKRERLEEVLDRIIENVLKQKKKLLPNIGDDFKVKPEKKLVIFYNNGWTTINQVEGKLNMIVSKDPDDPEIIYQYINKSSDNALHLEKIILEFGSRQQQNLATQSTIFVAEFIISRKN